MNTEFSVFGASFCPQKVLYGKNPYYIEWPEIENALGKVREVFENETTAYSDGDDFEQLAVTGMDISANLNLLKHIYSEEHLLEVLRIAKLQSIPRLKKTQYNTGVCFHNDSKSLTLYYKSQEMIDHHCCEAPGIKMRFLRAEMRAKAPSLRKERRMYRNVMADLHRLYSKYVKEATKRLDLLFAERFMNIETVEKAVSSLCGRVQAKNLIEFVRNEAAGAKLPHDVYRRRIKQLRDLGVSPFASELLDGDSLISMTNTRDNVSQQRMKRSRRKRIAITRHTLFKIYIEYNLCFNAIRLVFSMEMEEIGTDRPP